MITLGAVHFGLKATPYFSKTIQSSLPMLTNCHHMKLILDQYPKNFAFPFLLAYVENLNSAFSHSGRATLLLLSSLQFWDESCFALVGSDVLRIKKFDASNNLNSSLENARDFLHPSYSSYSTSLFYPSPFVPPVSLSPPLLLLPAFS